MSAIKQTKATPLYMVDFHRLSICIYTKLIIIPSRQTPSAPVYNTNTLQSTHKIY